MNAVIPVYEAAAGNGTLTWSTISTSGFSLSLSGRHTSKLRNAFTKELRKELKNCGNEELRTTLSFQTANVAKVRFEFKLGSGENISGEFPLVIASKRVTTYEVLRIAFHPMRPHDWFIVGAGDLDEQARKYFRKVWKGQTLDVIDQLRAPNRHRIRDLAVRFERQTLVDTLAKTKTVKDRLGPQKKPSGALQVIPEIASNLTARASDDDLPVTQKREPYSDNIHRAMKGNDRRAVVLLGAPAVGKRSLIHRFVHDLLEFDAFSDHRNLELCTNVWALSGRRLIAGMSYLGQWEERCVQIVEDLQRKPGILFINDIHAWGRIGRTVDSDRALADFFRGPIARNQCPISASCTPERWQRLESDAPEFAQLFTQIHIEETTAEQTFGFLFRRVRELERRHALAFSPTSLRTVVELSESLMSERSFPGKAIEIVELLAQEAAVQGFAEGRELDARDVFTVLSRRTGIPEEILEPDRALDLEALREQFSRYVKGQEVAVGSCIDVISRIKAGVCDPSKPYSVMMFTGPTGTGKTELAKCLAAYLYGASERLVRFDMSEYSGPDAVARLAGDHWQPNGLLTNAVRKQPFCVLLLDEIEKAHPTALNLLLQIFDDARLADAEGRVADFSHAVIIMTSNLGASSAQPVGFGGDSQEHDFLKAVELFFSPELFNRIDRVVPFHSLSVSNARAIAKKELQRLLSRRGLQERRVFVEPTDEVVETIVRDGFDKRDGARSLKRYLDSSVGSLLSEAIATGGAAYLRLFHLYADENAEFKLHADQLAEAEIVAGSKLEPLLEADNSTLRDALVEAKQSAQNTLDSETLNDAIEKMNSKLVSFNQGQHEQADQIYSVDGMRSALSTYVEDLDRLLGGELWDDAEMIEGELIRSFELKFHPEYGPQKVSWFHPSAMPAVPRRPTRDETLLLVAQSHFLKRTLKVIDDPNRHHATIVISTLGAADPAVRFGESREAFITSFAATLTGGKDVTMRKFVKIVNNDLVSPENPTTQGIEAMVVELFGFGIRDWLKFETGTHVMTSLGGSPEIIRVEVCPGEDATEFARSWCERRNAFRESLSSGSPLENPEPMLPIVRTYSTQKSHQKIYTKVEDYRIGWAGRFIGWTNVLQKVRALNHAIEEDDG